MATPVTQQRFPNKPGIYFEGIGTVTRAIAEWKIITYFDLAPIHTELQTLRNGTAILETLCPHLQQIDMCHELVKHFKSIHIELPETKKRRKARGAFNIVGNIANKLFGVLDNEYADDVSRVIKQLNDNENILADMIKNQTSVINTTLNVVKKDTNAIVLKINQLQTEANQISKEVVEVKKHINSLEIYTEISTQLALLAADLQRLEDDIFDTLIGVRHGKISPLLISPQQLKQEITKIKEHLPDSLHLPFNQNDVIHMYNLMSSECGVSTDHVIFIIRLPLTNNEIFQLFNIIPIPAIVNDTMVEIQPETSLLAATPHRDQYFALTKEALNSCKAIKRDSNQLLCSDKEPKYHQDAQAFSCEFQLLKNGTDKDCILKATKTEAIWIPLEHTNQWIFGTKYSTKVSAVCTNNGASEIIDLEGSSLITLQNDCTLKHHAATIQAHKIYTDIMYESHAAFGNFNLSDVSTSQLMFDMSPLNVSKELYQLKLLQTTIERNNLFGLPSLVKNESIHHHVTSYAALFLTFSFIIWLFCKLRATQSFNTAPVPAPRFLVDPELTN